MLNYTHMGIMLGRHGSFLSNKIMTGGRLLGSLFEWIGQANSPSCSFSTFLFLFFSEAREVRAVLRNPLGEKGALC